MAMEEVEVTIEYQPISTLKWVPRENLQANNYNPNRVPKIELDLLAQSLLTSGWTQPIVVVVKGGVVGGGRTLYEIVDGFHRWTIAERPEIAALTAGLVPIVCLSGTRRDLMLATIRHNRARGQHVIAPMAAIIRELRDDGMTEEEIWAELRMEDEEVERLYDLAPLPERASRGRKRYSKGWKPGART